jgi:hypothetical protein
MVNPVPWWRQPWRVKVAKGAIWLSEKLSYIRTWQTFYELDTSGADWMETFPKTRVAGRHKMQCRTSLKLMVWGHRFKGGHFDHWGLERSHQRYTYTCPECGGCVRYEPQGPGIPIEHFD